jgi:hypothetical protein
MDLITDRVVFEVIIDSNNYWDLEEAYEKKITIEDIYSVKKEMILNSLKTYEIEAYQTDFLPFPIQRNGYEYTCSVKLEILTEYRFGDPFLNCDIIVNRNEKSKIIKTLFEIRANAIDICGYFMSPFENRALIVTAREQWVWEGTALFYTFSGCHLGVGF